MFFWNRFFCNVTWNSLKTPTANIFNLYFTREYLGFGNLVLVTLLCSRGNLLTASSAPVKNSCPQTHTHTHTQNHTVSCPIMQLSTPVGAGTKEYLSLFVLHLGRAYLRPDCSSLNSVERGWVQSARIACAFLVALVLYSDPCNGVQPLLILSRERPKPANIGKC